MAQIIHTEHADKPQCKVCKTNLDWTYIFSKFQRSIDGHIVVKCTECKKLNMITQAITGAWVVY